MFKVEYVETDLVISFKGTELMRTPNPDPWVKEAIEQTYRLGFSNGELAGMKKAKKLIGRPTYE